MVSKLNAEWHFLLDSACERHLQSGGIAPDAAEEFVDDGTPMPKAHQQGRLPPNTFLINMSRPSVGAAGRRPHEFCLKATTMS
jgi:hypothetical protein